MTQYNVFYHFPCNDGEIAKLVWEQKYPQSKFYKWNHALLEQAITQLNKLHEEDTTIVFLDLCPSLDKLSKNHNYIIIDHHKNAIDEMNKNLSESNLYKIEMFCDTSKAGCMLVWDYCYNVLYQFYPKIVHHIGRKDIWDFTDIDTEPYTSGYNLYLAKTSSTIRELKKKSLLNDNEPLHDLLIRLGEQNIIDLKIEAKQYFECITLSKETIDTIEYNILDINCSDSSIFKYVCEYAMAQYPSVDVLRILHLIKTDKNTYSLRSLRDHINVDGIARFYGGNGHPKAAGYTVYI